MKKHVWAERLLAGSIWRLDLHSQPLPRALFIRSLRILILAFHGFFKNNSIRTASVLTYYSLLNFIPLIAVFFAIAKGFGLRRMIQNYVLQMADSAHIQPDIANHIILFSNSLLKHARGGIIAGIGVAVLLWTVISLLGRIEGSFNTIWEVKDSRPIIRKIADYISILVISPILLAVSISASVLVSSQVKSLLANATLSGTLNYFTILLLNLLPYFAIWSLLIVIYLMLPNKKVPIGAGIIAAIVAGTGFQVVQFVYIKVQMAISHYGALYGSFAAAPLFLGWLQLSWMIILFGAEISHAKGHALTFGMYPDYSRIDGISKKLMILRVFHLIVQRFHLGEDPVDAECISRHLRIPLKFVEKMIGELRKVGLLVEVRHEKKAGIFFQPARSIENITISDFFATYEKYSEGLPDNRSHEIQKIQAYIDEMYRDPVSYPGIPKIKDI
ncbi:MAG: YhjD/YihY/BrkB family envelope integrity protein [Syntrophorhabdaceae bacterium]